MHYWFSIVSNCTIPIEFGNHCPRIKMNTFLCFLWDTLCTQSLLRGVSVSTKTTLISGCVGGTVGVARFSKLGTFFLRSLTLRMPFYSNFQINGFSGETVFQNVQLFTTIKVVKSCIFWKTVSPQAPFI